MFTFFAENIDDECDDHNIAFVKIGIAFSFFSVNRNFLYP